jgi:hydroxypyruvate isomerase
MKRRQFLTSMAAVPFIATPAAEAVQNQAGAARSGRLKQSVMGSVWGNSNLSFEDRCKTLAQIGFKGMDLPQRQQVPILRDHGLAPALMTGTGTSFQNGLIRKELHDKFEEEFHKGVDMCAEVGCPTLIALPGERRGMSYEEGADNAVAIFDRVKGYAEQKGVTLCMEITNSKVAADQRTDQIFNHLAWGLDVCRRVNSPRVKILYDIYHVQISDGDITRNLRDNFDRICHIHVAGVPSRNEIDDNQELNYRFIAKAML